jgi:hypothetical protein
MERFIAHAAAPAVGSKDILRPIFRRGFLSRRIMCGVFRVHGASKKG